MSCFGIILKKEQSISVGGGGSKDPILIVYIHEFAEKGFGDKIMCSNKIVQISITRKFLFFSFEASQIDELLKGVEKIFYCFHWQWGFEN